MVVLAQSAAAERGPLLQGGFEIHDDNKPGKGILGSVGPDGLITDSIVVHGISAEFIRRDLRLKEQIEHGWTNDQSPVEDIDMEGIIGVTPDKVRVLRGEDEVAESAGDPAEAMVELTIDRWERIEETGLAVTTYQGPLEGLMWERAGQLAEAL